MAQDLSRLADLGVCCPACQGDLRLLSREDGLLCGGCALRYRIEDDIPVLLVEEAIRANPAPAAGAHA
jgi:uncharacterized protein YbaR (Trm112 family)